LSDDSGCVFLNKNLSTNRFIADKPPVKEPFDQGRPIQNFKTETFKIEAAHFFKIKKFV
jgi:hypothetical protein